jgi:hypothetical protein
MIWLSVLLAVVFLLLSILDAAFVIEISWQATVLLVIAALPILLPLLAKHLKRIKAGREGIEGEFRQGISNPEAANPAFSDSLQLLGQITSYELFSIWARKILKALWTYQVQYFGDDSKERWGFTVREHSPDSFAFHIGIGELLYHQYVFVNARGLYFLTDAGLEFCRRNRDVIEAERHYYKNFGSMD